MTTTILLCLAALIVGLIFVYFVSFFSGAETALISINKLKLKLMTNAGFKNAKILSEMMKEQELLISSMLVGLNIFVIVGTTAVTAILVRAFDSQYLGVTVTTIVMTPLYLIFGELIPKTIFRKNANKLALKHVRKIRFTFRLLYYVVKHVTVILYIIKKIFGGGKLRDTSLTKDDLQILIEMSEQEGILNNSEKDMINSIFEFSSLPVRDIMTPRLDMVCVSVDDSLDDVMKQALNAGFSRIPVYEEDIDHVIGFIYIRDLFDLDFEKTTVRDLMRNCKFVPESKNLDSLLKDMQKEKMQVAIIVDEYGGTAGLCTMEDIIEEIVGDIQDEYDRDEPRIQRMSGNVYIIAGIMDLDEFCEEFGLELDDDVESISVGGFIIEKLGRVPKVGETVVINKMKFVIERVDKRRIFKVKYVCETDVK